MDFFDGVLGMLQGKTKEEIEKDYITCPSTGHKYSHWKTYSDKTDPFLYTTEWTGRRRMYFPDLDDFLDWNAHKHTMRAIETHDNVESIRGKTDDLQKKMDTLIKMNEQIIEQTKDMAERIDKLERGGEYELP